MMKLWGATGMSIRYLIKYTTRELEEAYQLCSSQAAARRKVLHFLSRCEVEGKRRPFCDPFYYADHTVWMVTGTYKVGRHLFGREREEEDTKVFVFGLELVGDRPNVKTVYLVVHGFEDTDYMLFSDRDAARTHAMEFLSDCKVLECSRDFDDHSDYAGPGCVWWACESGSKMITIYEMQMDGPMVGLKPEGFPRALLPADFT